MPLPFLASALPAVTAAATAGDDGGGSFLSSFLPGLGALLGGAIDNRAFADIQNQITDSTQFNPSNFSGPGASVNSQFGTVTLDPLQQSLYSSLGGVLPGLTQGGLFNSLGVFNDLTNANLGGALGQAQGALSTQATPFFNQAGFGSTVANANALGNLFSNQSASGPQDFSGGAQNALLSGGLNNIAAAGDQSALFDQSLATQRAAASGGLLDQAINRLTNRQFNTGQAGTTGGALQTEAFLNSLAQQDLGFQNNAFNQALSQQQFLGNLGIGQVGQGAGLLGQNLGQYQNTVGNALGFNQLSAGLENQGFLQQLQALQANQQAGLNQLGVSQGLIGFGGDLMGQQMGLGLQGGNFLLDQAGFGRDTLVNLLNAEANRIGALGLSNQALAGMGTSGSGGLLAGIGNFLGGLF